MMMCIPQLHTQVLKPTHEFIIKQNEVLNDSIRLSDYPLYANSILIRKSYETNYSVYYLAQKNKVVLSYISRFMKYDDIRGFDPINNTHKLLNKTYKYEYWKNKIYENDQFELFMFFGSLAALGTSAIISDGKYLDYHFPIFMNHEEYRQWKEKSNQFDSY
ncbi:MAG: hypothetical protein KJO50_07290 [Bacteroidia bacterium]|nr:hypothetical protein [Bacteroidia bacterium]